MSEVNKDGFSGSGGNFGTATDKQWVDCERVERAAAYPRCSSMDITVEISKNTYSSHLRSPSTAMNEADERFLM